MDSLTLELAELCGRLEGMSPSLDPSFGAGASAVYVDARHDSLIFRGTVDVAGWLHDFDVTNDTVYGLGAVHRGFYNALAALMPRIQSLGAASEPSIVCGHSLGAAMAVLFAGVLAVRGVKTSVYAFEPPRPVASDVLVDAFRRAGTMWLATRNGNDIVTQLPPWLTLPGPLTEIGHPAHPWDNFTDHHIWNVIAALKQADVRPSRVEG